MLDASVVIDLLLGTTPKADSLRQRIRAERGLVAPHLLDAEVAQVFRRYVLRGELTPHRASGAIDDLVDLRLTRYPHLPLLARAFALRDNVTIYDGLYLALAEALRAPLITLDAALHAVPGCDAVVEVIA